MSAEDIEYLRKIRTGELEFNETEFESKFATILKEASSKFSEEERNRIRELGAKVD